MRYKVVFDPAADADLTELYDYIALRAGRSIARRYIDTMVDHCSAFETFPSRGMRHDELGLGVRIVGFRRKASIVFRIDDDIVTIMRILHGGKSLAAPDDADEDDLF